MLAAIAVLVENERVLLVRRRNPPDAGLWGYPGGKVEFGETVEQAAVRELAEETGVEAQPLRFLTIVNLIGTSATGRYHFALAAVLCRRLSGRPAAADDVSEAIWHPLQDIIGGRVATSEHVADVARLAPAPGR